MAINNKGCNYKLHEFLGDASEHRQLFELYFRFRKRSQPLPTKAKTFTGQFSEWENYFTRMIQTNKIIFATEQNKIIGFIAFDFNLKSLTIPETLQQMIQSKPQSQYCEFVFAASESKLSTLKSVVADIFHLLKEKYNVLYVVGNVNREHKKDKYIKTIQRIFGFKVFHDFALHEIP